MKRVFLFLAILTLALRLPGQTNAPARLALISEPSDASAAADVLTAELSGNPKIQLLERNEIEKIYREQGLSAANKDYLKLGQILGADGLLLMETVKEGTNQFLNVRLIAVKPGVILAGEKFVWPVKDPAEWSASFARHLDLFFPKLTVLVKDAIPISVVNLRSAVSSGEAQETERQLKLLTIQRLSREPQFFVLERQRMELLSGEKELQTDESAFWNGSYLLEGVVDQNGYSQETITINARLTPPKGGAPLPFEVSGSRTNLAEVINQLAAKVNEALKVNSTVPAWNAADEAAQYFNEAQWALRWGVFSEAQAAADSAWALGKRDLECAALRINACLLEISAEVGGYQIVQRNRTSGFYANSLPMPQPARFATLVANQAQPEGIAPPPNAENIGRAIAALEIYKAFSRTSPDGEPKILWRGKGSNDWRNSDWYQLGIDDLVVASHVLQKFNAAPAAQPAVADQLAELRALARSVAGLISAASSVHDSYYVGDRVATRDELAHTIEEHPNIFRCEVNWGCYWQERPEDGVALYRELMSSPVFRYLHGDLWSRKLQTPRLAAWDEASQKSIPAVWQDFVRELSGSTNVLWQMEAKALMMTDAPNDEQARAAHNELLEIVRTHHRELVENNVEIFYLRWGLGDPELAAMDQEYWQMLDARKKQADKQVALAGNLAAFEKQKQFLKDLQPFNFQNFVPLFLFGFKDYSQAQALELMPLITAYKSNLVAQTQVVGNEHNDMPKLGLMQLRQVEANVNSILTNQPPATRPASPPKVQPPAASSAPVTARTVVPPPASHAPAEMVTNVLPVNKFLAIPLDGLPGSQVFGVTITAHHWLEEKLVLDFQYNASVYKFDENKNWQQTQILTFPAIAILDPASERWEVIGCPAPDPAARNNFYHRTILLHGELFTSDGGQIKKYSFTNRQWLVLPVSSGENFELFAVNDRLYAANRNQIFEITDDGKSTRLLSSTRRQPPVSALDTQDFGTPTLFAGPDHSLRVSTINKFFTWAGTDWREDSAAPAPLCPPEIFPEGIIFRHSSGRSSLADNLSRLMIGETTPELCFGPKPRTNNVPISSPAPAYIHTGPIAMNLGTPLWKLPSGYSLANLSAALRQANLYLLAGHSDIQKITNSQNVWIEGKVLDKDGCNAILLCFTPDLPLPQKVFLKFDSPAGPPPLAGIDPGARQGMLGMPPAWLLFAGDRLLVASEMPVGALPSSSGRGAGYQTGVWLLPVLQLNQVIAAQKQLLLDQLAQAAVSQDQARKNLLAKYDLNHNGLIDPDERETALDDPAFSESELDNIDTNHNGWLDVAELAWFDANQNKILEPKEQAGIDIVQHLLAGRLLKKFDAYDEGVLNGREYDDMIQSTLHIDPRVTLELSHSEVDANHDGKIDAGELETLLKQQTRGGLRSRRVPGAASFNQMRMDPNQPVDPRQMFKAALESYWQNPGSVTNQPPFGNRIPGAGFVPNRTPQGATQ